MPVKRHARAVLGLVKGVWKSQRGALGLLWKGGRIVEPSLHHTR